MSEGGDERKWNAVHGGMVLRCAMLNGHHSARAAWQEASATLPRRRRRRRRLSPSAHRLNSRRDGGETSPRRGHDRHHLRYSSTDGYCQLLLLATSSTSSASGSAKSEICVLFMNTRKMVVFGTIRGLFLFLRRCSEG